MTGVTAEARPGARAAVGEWVGQCRAWAGIWEALASGCDQEAGGQDL